MSRYIDADELELRKCTAAGSMSEYGRGWNDAIAAVVENAPTIEAEPVLHGRWKDRGGLLMPMHRYDEFTNPESIFNGTCSECGITVYQSGILNGFNYCPNCGARMDGDNHAKEN